MFHLINALDGATKVSTLVRICGSCDTPVANHTADNNVVISYGSFTIECYREWDTIGFSSWYDNFTGREVSDYVLQDGIATLALDVSGPETQSGSDLITKRIAEDYDLFGLGADEAPYVSPLDPYSEQAKVDRWSDTTPDICTVTLEQHLTGLATEGRITSKGIVPNIVENVIDDTLRNAYVEGNDAFLSVKLLDEELTKKYHQHLLNVFLDKNTGDVRIGSIRISKNSNGTLTARCVNRNCGPTPDKSAKMTFNPTDAVIDNYPVLTEAERQEKVWDIVSHGNNHAASWFKSKELKDKHEYIMAHRDKDKKTGEWVNKTLTLTVKAESSTPAFHKVHRLGCDLSTCDGGKWSHDLTAQPHCSTVHYSEVLTDAEQLAFLQEHAVHCKDDKCAHVLRIWELTSPPVNEPALNLHVQESAA